MFKWFKRKPLKVVIQVPGTPAMTLRAGDQFVVTLQVKGTPGAESKTVDELATTITTKPIKILNIKR